MPTFVRCKQCGELKATTFFRKYYSGRTGYNKTCLPCESINTRFKYLTKKSEVSTNEYKAIADLYAIQRAKGLKPPGLAKTETIKDRVEAELQRHHEHHEVAIEHEVSDATPPELLDWLTCSLEGHSPEYLQDIVYTELQAKYRPVLQVDSVTLLPVHDDTYRYALNKILKRFDDYEDGL